MNDAVERKGTIAVWFSCGAASAVAAKMTLEKYGNDFAVRIINNPVAEEHPDNRRFLRDVEEWIGKKIEVCVNPNHPNASAVEVWEKRRYMSGIAGAPCTGELKKKARQHWEKHNQCDWIVLGFTYDEKERSDRFRNEEKSNLLPILVDEKITKADCFKILIENDIDVPEMYKLGYPNANCIGCVKSSSPTYWNLVRRKHPSVFKQRSEMSRELGTKLVRVKGKRIYLDELNPNTKGGNLKTMQLDCGVFCEERRDRKYIDE